MNQAVITQLHNILFLLVYEEGVLAECHPLPDNQSLQIGNIYIGRVEKVVKNIQSAFIRLDVGHVGYLPLDDKPALILNRTLPKGLPSIAENDLILVQVEKEPQKMKQAKVTGNISLGGAHVVLDLQKGMIGVSRKIKDKDRIRQLKGLLVDTKYGCVFRTACELADDQTIFSEYEVLAKEFNELVHKAFYEKRTGCIKKGKQEYLAILEEYGIDRIHEVKTDIPEVAKQLEGAVSNVVLYKDEIYPLYKLLSLETEINKLLNKKVWLKSGGFLVIEPTEAMVVIDVNSGKSIGKKNKDSHILKLNLEAAKEISKQLRLRNLSGIIVIDFINMQSKEDKAQVIQCLEQGFKRDKTPAFFVEITRLDLFELTRKKIRKPLHEVLTTFPPFVTLS